MDFDKPFIVVRDDGYSPYACYGNPYPLSDAEFLRMNVDYMARFPAIRVKEIGCGPGCTFTYDTKLGEHPFANCDAAALTTVRDLDRNAARVLAVFLARGTDPIDLVAHRCHELGIKTWVRWELNPNYGIPAADNMPYIAFTDRFCLEHPEYRIGYDPQNAPFGFGTMLDFAIPEVRAHRLRILRELAEHDIDGVSLDFCVGPPFLSQPERDAHILTQFMRDVRVLLDGIGAAHGLHIDLIIRLDHNANGDGLRWQDWIAEGLIDCIIPSVTRLDDCWGIPLAEFVNTAHKAGCRVLTCIRPFVNTLVWTDPAPQDARSGIRRTEEHMTKESLYAKAYAGLMSGADGVQIAIATGGLGDTRPIDPRDEYRRDGWRDVYAQLADIDFLSRQNKLYTFNNDQGLPAHLTQKEPDITLTIDLPDEPARVKRAVLVLHGRGLTPYETIRLTVNGEEMPLTERELHWASYDTPILTGKELPRMLLFRIPEWWNICRNEIELPAACLRRGINTFRFHYSAVPGTLLKNPDYTFGRMSVQLDIV